MKRSTCLSTLLVGLSVLTASVAIAAPSAKKAKPVRVAQAQTGTTDPNAPAQPAAPTAPATAPAAPADGAAQPSTTTTDDDANKPADGTKPADAKPADGTAPADGAKPADAAATQPAGGAAPAAQPQPGAGTTPAAPGTGAGAASDDAAAPGAATPPASSGTGFTLSLGSNPNQKDQPQAEPAKPEAKPPMRRWAGSNVFGATTMSTSTVFQGQQQYKDPTVESYISLAPRFRINDSFQLRGYALFYYEYTNSDSTTTRNEPRLSDSTVYLYYDKLPKLAGFKFWLAPSVTLPTSPESRARTMVATPGMNVQIARGFENVLGADSFLTLARIGFSHPFYTDTTAGLRNPAPYQFTCFGTSTCGNQLNGNFNAANILSYAVFVVPQWGKWSPGIYYSGSSYWDYDGKALSYQGNPVTAPAGFNPVSVRQSSYFSFWLDYLANDWLTAEVGYQMQRSSVLAADGSYGNPFFDRYQNMTVYLGANVAVDSLVEEITGKGNAKGGIVRAHNTKTPFGTF